MSIVIVYGSKSRPAGSDGGQPLTRHHLLISNLVSSVVCLDATFRTSRLFPPLEVHYTLLVRNVARCDL